MCVSEKQDFNLGMLFRARQQESRKFEYQKGKKGKKKGKKGKKKEKRRKKKEEKKGEKKEKKGKKKEKKGKKKREPAGSDPEMLAWQAVQLQASCPDSISPILPYC